MKKKSVRGLAAVCTLILLLIFSVAAYADTPTATDELDAVQQYVDDNNITLEDKENGMPFYLRTAYVMDVAASKEGMADSKYTRPDSMKAMASLSACTLWSMLTRMALVLCHIVIT